MKKCPKVISLNHHINCVLDYKVEYEEVLDNLAHKKIKLLKMKQAAEKIQNHKVTLTSQDVDKMLDLKVDKMKSNKKNTKAFKEDGKVDYDNKEENDDNEDAPELLGEDEMLEIEDDEEGEELEDDSDLEDIEDNLEDDEELEDGDVEELENEDLENISYYSDDNEEGKKEDNDSEDDENNDDELRIQSEELVSDEDEEIPEKNIHGFLEPENLLTYKKTYREKAIDFKNQQKVEYKHQRNKTKGGGTTNKEKLKNKPLMMVIGKKRKIVSEKLVLFTYIY